MLLKKKHIGSVDPHALKIPARRAEYSLTENACSPVHAEPGHLEFAVSITRSVQAIEGSVARDRISRSVS